VFVLEKVSGFSVVDGSARVCVNPKLHNLDVVYSAAYTFLDKAYILLDGDPDNEIIVTIRPKDGYNAEKLGFEFSNELLNYSHYKSKVKELGVVRQVILQRALLVYDTKNANYEDGNSEEVDSLIDEDLDFEDVEDIATPWEEKYGDKEDSSKIKKEE
jgi:His-Xaa-Ser system protein HxsD